MHFNGRNMINRPKMGSGVEMVRAEDLNWNWDSNSQHAEAYRVSLHTSSMLV